VVVRATELAVGDQVKRPAIDHADGAAEA